MLNRFPSDSKSLLSHNRVLQSASLQITPVEATFLGSTEVPFHFSVAPSILVVRGSLVPSAPPVVWKPTPPSMFSPVPRMRHP